MIEFKTRPQVRCERVWPFWRAVFFVFWVNDLGKIVAKIARERGIEHHLPHAVLAWGVFLLNLFARLDGWVAWVGITHFVFLMPINELARKANGAVSLR